MVTLNKIQRFVQNFMPYKMIYHLPHKFEFLSFHFSRFCEHFHQLREIMINKIHRFLQNFMLYKIIYHLPHKFVFLNFRVCHFANIFVNYARNAS